MKIVKSNSLTVPIILMIISFIWSPLLAANESQLWLSSTANLWKSKSGNTKALFYGEVRNSLDFKESASIFFGPIVKYQLNENVDVGGAYKFLNTQDGRNKRNNRSRIELEITPYFSFGDLYQYKLALRNRIEVIKDTGANDVVRQRHKFTLNKSYPNNRIIKSLFSSQEFIYIYKDGRSDLNQYRFIPFGAKLNVFNQKINAFLMIQRINNKDGDKNYILGLSYVF